ncbi:hypothetical protein JNUCC64_30610 [Streptomyces sp. JNUCC 64]
MRIRVRVPVRVRLVGTPDEERLAELSAAVARLVAARLAEAERLLAERRPARPVPAPPPRERYDPERTGPDGYTVPSYGGRGAPVAVPVRGGDGPPWRVLRAVEFRTTVGDFLDWVEDELSEPLADRVLYADRDAEVRRVTVWWAQTERTVDLGGFAGELAGRARELGRLGPGELLAHAVTPFDAGLARLADLDPSGRVRALPRLGDRNARRVRGTGTDAELLHGARVVFAAMALPVVTTAGLLDVGPPVTGGLPLREAGFMVDPDRFARVAGAPWSAYAEAFGDEPVRVTLRPVTVRRTTTTDAAGLLLSRLPDGPGDGDGDGPGSGTTTGGSTAPGDPTGTAGVAGSTASTGGPAPGRPDTARAEHLLPRTGPALAALPPAVRALLGDGGGNGSGSGSGTEASTGSGAARGTRTGPGTAPGAGAGTGPEPDPTAGPEDRPTALPAGTRLLYLRAWLRVDAERSGLAVLRPLARPLTERLRALLPGEPSDPRWVDRLRALVLDERLGPVTPPVRPPGGTVFEWTLTGLTARERELFFTALAGVGDFGLRHRVLLLALATRHAADPRVQALRSALRTARAAATRHRYRTDTSPTGILLERDPAQWVGAGEVLGDRDPTYVSHREVRRLRPARATALRNAVERERVALVEKLASSDDQRELSEEEFAREVLALAVRAIRLTEEDFENVTVERSLRLVGVTEGQLDQLPSYTVRFRFTERVRGSGWEDVSEPLEESAGEFEARLVYWRLGRSGDYYRAAGLGLLVVAALLAAWEAGLIGLLVQLAGGTGAVVTSIAASEVLYVLRVVFGDARLTLEGVLVAALDGYLMALGMGRGAALGRWVAGRIGTASLRRVWAGWLGRRLAAGAAGGALTAGLETFAHDVIQVVTGRGGWSSVERYLTRISAGAALGVVAEFTLQPALRAVLARVPAALAGARETAALLRSGGWSGTRLAAALTEGLSRMGTALREVMDTEVSWRLVTTLHARLGEVLRETGAGIVTRHVLELSRVTMTPAATKGLERFLRTAEVGDPRTAWETTRLLVAHPDQTVALFEVVAGLDEPVARRFLTETFAGHVRLAAFLGRLAGYPPAVQRSAIRVLAVLGIREGAPVPTATAEEVLERQFALGARLRAANADAEAERIRRRIAALEGEAERALAAGKQRRALVKRQEAEELGPRLREQEEQAAAIRADAAGRPGDQLPTDPEITALIDRLERGAGAPGTGPQAWVTLPARKLEAHPEALPWVVRTVFRSRSGHRVVFRVQGGTSSAKRSRNLVTVKEDGNVVLRPDGHDLYLNFGVYERAVEFLAVNRKDAQLVVFEIEEEYFRRIRGIATPQVGHPAKLLVEDPVTGVKSPFAPPDELPGITDVRRVPRTVDTRDAVDQLQIPSGQVPELQEFVVPGSGRVVEFR